MRAIRARCRAIACWCALLPFAALTVLPWPVCLWSREFSFCWATLPFTSRTGAAGDLLAVYLLLPRGVAAHGIVRNRSWRTWRRIPSG
jgi:hypothetical protein